MPDLLPQNNINHLKKVDVLRAIAIISVFVFHAQNHLFPHYSINTYNSDGTIAAATSRDYILNFSPIAFGWSGVQLFLIISGFLIHLGYLTNQDKFNLRSFFSKRFWRIYPPYLLILSFICFNRKAKFLYTLTGLKQLLTHLFLVHNLSDSMFFTLNGSFWSLALEVQLYLVYPAFLILRKRIGIKKAFWLLVGFSLACNFIGQLLHIQTSFAYSWSVLQFWFIWAGGAYLAECYFNKQRMFYKGAFVYSLLFFTVAIGSKYFSFTTSYQNLLVTFGWLAFFESVFYAKKLFQKGIITTVLILIGTCSYSIYLIHESFLGGLLGSVDIIPYTVRNFFLINVNLFLRPMVVFVMIFMISYSLYIFVEQKSVSIGQERRKKGKF